MSEELELGQRELTSESDFASFSGRELDLVAQNAAGLLLDLVKATGAQTINAALGGLAGIVESALAEKPPAEPSGEASAPPAEE